MTTLARDRACCGSPRSGSPGRGAASPAEAVRRLGRRPGAGLPRRAHVGRAAHGGRAAQDVEAALDAGEIVRSWPMRGTLHLRGGRRPALDARPARAPDARRRRPRRWARSGSTRTTPSGPASSPPRRWPAAARLRRAELLAGASTAAASPRRGSAATTCSGTSPQTGTLCLGPTDGAASSCSCCSTSGCRAPRRLDRDEALGELALRYFLGHGPATVQDLARWAGIPLARRRGRAWPPPATGSRRSTSTASSTSWTRRRPTGWPPAARRPSGVFLLPGFDEFVLGYGDRTRRPRPRVRRADRAGQQRHVPADRRHRRPGRRHLAVDRPRREADGDGDAVHDVPRDGRRPHPRGAARLP